MSEPSGHSTAAPDRIDSVITILGSEYTKLVALLSEVAASGISYSARDYHEVQISRETWDAIQALPVARQKD